MPFEKKKKKKKNTVWTRRRGSGKQQIKHAYTLCVPCKRE
jgi:hypothetical protein